MKRVLVVMVLLAAPAAPAPCSADDQERSSSGGPQPVFEIDPGVEIPLLLMSAVVMASVYLPGDLSRSECAPLCDEADVNALDSWSAGFYDEGWKLASDISVGVTLGASAIAVLVDGGFSAGIVDALVVGESVVLTMAATGILKISVHRSRPYMYGEEAPSGERREDYSGVSFPSGHVSIAAAATTSAFSVLRVRNPDSPWPWVYLGCGTILTGLTGTGRIMAGKHFLTDVVFGAALGAAVGFIVPAIHDKRRVDIAPMANSRGGGLLMSADF